MTSDLLRRLIAFISSFGKSLELRRTVWEMLKKPRLFALTKRNLSETQNAIAAAQAAIADARAADLERNLVEAREAYANDAVAEGRAARAAARALVEAEGRERRVADEDYAEQLRELIAETKGQLQAAAEALVEQARRDARPQLVPEYKAVTNVTVTTAKDATECASWEGRSKHSVELYFPFRECTFSP